MEAALARLTGMLEAERGTDTKRLGFTIARGEAIAAGGAAAQGDPGVLRWAGDPEGGAPFVEAAGGSVLIGGDWTTGARVESAWDSGEAMASRLLHGAPVAQA